MSPADDPLAQGRIKFARNWHQNLPAPELEQLIRWAGNRSGRPFRAFVMEALRAEVARVYAERAARGKISGKDQWVAEALETCKAKV